MIIKLRRGTTAQWTTSNRVLDSGEPGFDIETKEFKIGDGVTPWLSLQRSDAASVEAALVAHIVDEADAHDASSISFVPSGSLLATDVQSAIAALDTALASKADAAATASALAGKADATETTNALATKADTSILSLVATTGDFNDLAWTPQTFSQDFVNAKLGPVSTDFTAVTINAPGDGATYNQQYVLSSASFPAGWPIDNGEGLHFIVAQGSWNLYSFGPINAMPRSLRTMCDGDKFCWYTAAGATHGQRVYIDGRPTSLTPYATGAAGQFHTITFPTAKPRLIEIRTSAPVVGFYTQKPYQLWTPPPRRGPRTLVIGDSYAAGSGAATLMNGAYYDIGPAIGSEDIWLDAVGGTGYGVTSAADGLGTTNRYLDRINKVISGQTWDIGTISPDMIVVHGGGANDKYKGRTNTQVIDDVTSMFTQLRAAVPSARLVFVEGFAPPTGFSTYNPDYIAIRQGAQAALAGVGVYYIDVATTKPWIEGTGKVGATTGVGNSDIYVGTDGTHPSDAGHLYIRNRIAPKLRRVLADDGTLLNTLI